MITACLSYLYLPMGSRIKTLKKICIYKAPGPDELSNWLIWRLFLPIVCAIFNSSLRQGQVPKIWKQANVRIYSSSKEPFIQVSPE